MVCGKKWTFHDVVIQIGWHFQIKSRFVSHKYGPQNALTPLKFIECQTESDFEKLTIFKDQKSNATKDITHYDNVGLFLPIMLLESVVTLNITLQNIPSEIHESSKLDIAFE